MERFIPNAPLFQDPIYDGAADPVVIWNHNEQAWWMFYTNRRASEINHGVSYMHGTKIGIASSKDFGKTWIYRGSLDNLEFEPGTNTFWAPEIIFAQGQYHMYISYVRGIPNDWNCERHILHYISNNLWNWNFQGIIPLSSDRVIDACVFEVTPGKYKMWYKDEVNNSYTYSAESNDLYNWKVLGPEITDCPHEGPNVFYFQDTYWMITDPWCGLGVYRSEDACHWERKENILRIPGNRKDDGSIGAHADVVVNNNHAYIFYFTHPEVSEKERHDENFKWEYRHRRSSIQVANLIVEDSHLICDRNNVRFSLMPPATEK